jgi:hypothetical protein
MQARLAWLPEMTQAVRRLAARVEVAAVAAAPVRSASVRRSPDGAAHRESAPPHQTDVQPADGRWAAWHRRTPLDAQSVRPAGSVESWGVRSARRAAAEGRDERAASPSAAPATLAQPLAERLAPWAA